jgi:hypothetical protein
MLKILWLLFFFLAVAAALRVVVVALRLFVALVVCLVKLAFCENLFSVDDRRSRN